jgi:membrane protein DedA with SNARE-associated domain
VDAWLTTLLEALASIGAWRFLVAFVGIFAETSLFVGLVIPGDTIVLFTSTANRGFLDWLLLLLSVLAGSLAGESLGYLIGAWFGPRLRASRLGARIGERNWVRAEQWVGRRGGLAIFLSRFLPILHALVPVTVGMSEYPYRRFLAWTAPACLLWGLIYVSVGTAAGSSYRHLSQELHSAGWIFFGVLIAFLLLVGGGKRLLRRLERRLSRR